MRTARLIPSASAFYFLNCLIFFTQNYRRLRLLSVYLASCTFLCGLLSMVRFLFLLDGVRGERTGQDNCAGWCRLVWVLPDGCFLSSFEHFYHGQGLLTLYWYATFISQV